MNDKLANGKFGEITFDGVRRISFCLPLFAIILLFAHNSFVCASVQDGEVVVFDRHRYLAKVEEQAAGMNPYAALYLGFERRWAYWKVVVTLSKLLLIAPAIVLWRYPVVQVSVLLCTVTFYANLAHNLTRSP